MNQQIIAISWSHHQVPLVIRDKLALSHKEIKQFSRLTVSDKILELAALSTCNRIEFYALAGSSIIVLNAIKNLYANILKRDIPWHLAAPEIYIGMDTVLHLCRVAAGMESIVLGEIQILSQVKASQETLAKSQPTANILINLFNHATLCAETIRNETPISIGPTSISELAVQTAQRIFDNLEHRKLMLIGAGETAELTARHFRASGIKDIIIANRSEKRGRALADSVSADFTYIHHINEALHKCDVIVTATYATDYLIMRNQIENIMSERTEMILFMDLSTPRNIDPSIHDINNVCIYDLDHLDAISSINRKNNQEALSNSEMIVKNYSRKWMEWFQLKDLKDKELELIEETY